MIKGNCYADIKKKQQYLNKMVYDKRNSEW